MDHTEGLSPTSFNVGVLARLSVQKALTQHNGGLKSARPVVIGPMARDRHKFSNHIRVRGLFSVSVSIHEGVLLTA